MDQNILKVQKMSNTFPKDLMQKLFEGCAPVTYKKGQMIYRTNEVLTNVFWLSEGQAEVYVSTEDGQKQVLAFHYPHSIVGEVESLYGHPCGLNCSTTKKSTLCKCNVDIFLDRIQELGLTRQYLALLAGKAHSSVVHLANLALNDCQSRIQSFYNSELTHQQLSELVGCSRVQVTRILNKENYDLKE